MRCQVIDLFCGCGGFAFGLGRAGHQVLMGVDTDEGCRHAFEANVKAPMLEADIEDLTAKWMRDEFSHSPWKDMPKLVSGGPPCQGFSSRTFYAGDSKPKLWDPRRSLALRMAQLATEAEADFVAMENVPAMERSPEFADVVMHLNREGYAVRWWREDAVRYGVPQRRRRLILLAGRRQSPPEPRTEPAARGAATVGNAITHLPPLEAGQVDADDPLHRCARLDAAGMEKMRHAVPGGTWRDFPPELVTGRWHVAKDGSGFFDDVYGRMEWDRPAPTLTTNFNRFSCGRFGHPEQDRAISLREGALLQSFPETYQFEPPDRLLPSSRIARMIGNAIPPRLSTAVGDAFLEA